MSEHKPCPWCGNTTLWTESWEDKVYNADHKGDFKYHTLVTCARCGAKGPVVTTLNKNAWADKGKGMDYDQSGAFAAWDKMK